MQWDDELWVLVEKVRDRWGGELVTDAYIRAVTSTAPLSPESIDADVLVSETHVDKEHTKFVDGRVAAAAFKRQLKQLLQIH
jgi:hypothetical protein